MFCQAFPPEFGVFPTQWLRHQKFHFVYRLVVGRSELELNLFEPEPRDGEEKVPSKCKAGIMSKRWQIFWLIWISCFIPVAWSLRSSHDENLGGRKAIAKVEKIEGSVTVRTESQMTWQKVKANQELYNNDLISTEDKSRVSILFTNGRRLQLTPGSVVKLGLPSPLSKDTEVSVLKGRLLMKAEDPKAVATDKKDESNDNRMIIRTQNDKIIASSKPLDVNSKDSNPVQLAEKPTSVAAAAAAIAAGSPASPISLDPLKNLNIGESIKLAALAPGIAAPSTKAEEKCVPTAEDLALASADLEKEDNKEKVSLPPFEFKYLPQIAPLSGEFWTAEPIRKVADKALRLEIDIPDQLPKDIRDSWKGIVNISGPEGHIRIDGKVSQGKKRLSVTLKDLMAAKVIKDINQASFAVNAGYSIESESLTDAIEHASPTTSVYSMRSLAEGEGIMIGFDKLQTVAVPNPWLLVTPKTGNRIWIGVTEPQDRQKLFQIVQANNGQVSRADWPGIPVRGAYIVRGDKIVGIVNGRDISQSEWDRIRQLFGADLIFRGSGHSYISRTTFDVSKTNERTLYVLNRGEFVEIDVSLLRSRPKSMNFVKGVSSFLFREQPEILSQAR